MDGPEGRDAYTFTVAEDSVAVGERSADGADARVIGPAAAWVKAFSPERDRSGLELTGDLQLAGVLLDGLLAAGGRASDRAPPTPPSRARTCRGTSPTAGAGSDPASLRVAWARPSTPPAGPRSAGSDPSPPAPGVLAIPRREVALGEDLGVREPGRSGYVFPRLFESRLAANDNVSDPTGENWRR